MNAAAAIPGLTYQFVRPQAQLSPLRTDVAGFFGRTERGPVGTAVRVAGWREYGNVFGNLVANACTPYGVRGYFDNGAQVAYVVRVLGKCSLPAMGTWCAGQFSNGQLDADWPGASGLQAIQYQIQASSPGDWANQTIVQFRYWAKGPTGNPEIEVETAPPNETVEILSGLDPATIDTEVNQQSQYIRLTPLPLPPGLAATGLSPPLANPGPRYYEWPAKGSLQLTGGTCAPPLEGDYMDAVQTLGDQIEVALLACPDLAGMSQQIGILNAMLTQADQLHDRLVIIDVPPTKADPLCAIGWVDTSLRQQFGENLLRNGAVYHPPLFVPDPLGGVANPQLSIPPSGCVTGVISRLDVQQGAYITPANAQIEEAVDLAIALDANQQANIYNGGINLLTCSPGRGLMVWGGRVLGKGDRTTKLGGFVAHRRLIHLLVRAIRRVAEPLVFDTNGPELWLHFVRSITTVLLQAYNAGALQGDQPGQAFQVICDASTNPPDQIDQGMVVCVVKVAPAVPMEFITLRVSVSAAGQLEVFES
jgi:Bacteriophage tail sheath protein